MRGDSVEQNGTGYLQADTPHYSQGTLNGIRTFEISYSRYLCKSSEIAIPALRIVQTSSEIPLDK